MNIDTAIQLAGGSGFDFVTEKESSRVFGANYISKVMLGEETELSGKITSISREGITLNREKFIPYSTISELKVTAEEYKS